MVGMEIPLAEAEAVGPMQQQELVQEETMGVKEALMLREIQEASEAPRDHLMAVQG
jgi:hypothetical protein